MKIKTFPLQFTEEKLTEIREVAKKNKLSIKDFIFEAIETKMKEGK